jgi:hypothetical protein
MVIRPPTSRSLPRSILRLVLGFCLLLGGIPSTGICIEPDGASHVASADHLCCDAPAPNAESASHAVRDDVSASVHECAHTPLATPSGAPTKLEHARAVTFLVHAAPVDVDPYPETTPVRLDGSRLRPPDLTPLSTVLLRL